MAKMEANEEYKPIEPIYFEFKTIANGKEEIKKYVYDYRLVTIEQAEIAIAVAQFRNDQLDLKPGKVDEVIKSEGHKYVTNAVKHLLVEVIDGKPMPFDDGKVLAVEKYLNESKIMDGIRDKEVECYNDFFTAAGLKHMLLSAQKIERRARTMNFLLSTLENSQRELISKKLQSIVKESPTRTKKTNSQKGSRKRK